MLQVLVLRKGWEAVGKDAVRQGEEEYIFFDVWSHAKVLYSS
jgi:hypothetical protein